MNNHRRKACEIKQTTMKKLIFTTILIATTALFWSGCTENKPGSIFGIVTDITVGEPMRATGVELFRDNLLITRTVTGNDGQFEFQELVAGNYRLNVVADGFQNTEFNVEVRAGQASRMDMQLTREPTGLTVRTLEVTNVGGNSATLNGNVSWTRGVATEQGFFFATHNNPADGGTRVTTTLDNNRNFSTTITNLTTGTFYVQAYATNAVGTEFGEVRSFVITGVPAVTTLPVTNIIANTATFNGRIDFAGDPTFTERGFVFGQAHNPTIEDATKIVVAGTGGGVFSANVIDLARENTYHIRAFAINSIGTAYGEEIILESDFAILQDAGFMVARRDAVSDRVSFGDAHRLCENSRLGGYSDWRLPSTTELTIMFQEREVIGGFYISTPWGARYWRNANCFDLIMVNTCWIDFSSGSAGGTRTDLGTTPRYRVRCVRTLP